jgi:hypothetical protein
MVSVSSSSIESFLEWKIRGGATHLTFQLQDGEITITSKGTGNHAANDWSSFCQQLRPDEPCWAVLHFNYTSPDGAPRSKTTMVQWIPSQADKKDKMNYAMWTPSKQLYLEFIVLFK